MPSSPATKMTGGRRTTGVRDVFDVALYVATTRCLSGSGQVAERAFAWLGRCRRLSLDWDTSVAGAEAWVLIAHIRRAISHLARE